MVSSVAAKDDEALVFGGFFQMRQNGAGVIAWIVPFHLKGVRQVWVAHGAILLGSAIYEVVQFD